MAEVVELRNYVEKNLEREWHEYLMEYLKGIDHVLFPSTIVTAMEKTLGIIDDSGSRLGALPLGAEFWYTDKVAVFMLYDRYDHIQFTDKGTTRSATEEDEENLAPADQEKMDSYHSFMSIHCRTLKPAEKLTLRSRPVIASKELVQRVLDHADLVEASPNTEHSTLIISAFSIPHTLVDECGYIAHETRAEVNEKNHRVLEIIMTGHGHELLIMIDIELLDERYELYMKRFHAWYNEFITPTQEAPMKKGTDDC